MRFLDKILDKKLFKVYDENILLVLVYNDLKENMKYRYYIIS